MYHVPAHKNRKSPAGQIVNGHAAQMFGEYAHRLGWNRIASERAFDAHAATTEGRDLIRDTTGGRVIVAAPAKVIAPFSILRSRWYSYPTSPQAWCAAAQRSLSLDPGFVRASLDVVSATLLDAIDAPDFLPLQSGKQAPRFR